MSIDILRRMFVSVPSWRMPRADIAVTSVALGFLVWSTAPSTAGIMVQVNPGAFTGDWAHAEPSGVRNYAPGPRTIEVEEGFNFMFAGSFDGFQFNVAADGSVTTGAAATGGVGTITFNTVDVALDPGDFSSEYFISRVVGGTAGAGNAAFVPTLEYIAFVGGGNLARFNFKVAIDGQVTLTANPAAATGGAGSLTFNTSEVFVDPGGYAGSWQVPGVGALTPIVQTVGSASAILVTGVTYVIIPDRSGLNFPVMAPCTTTELDFIDFVFTVGCSPITHRCEGFQAPMNKVVTVRNHRALPLKADLFDEAGFAVTDLDVIAVPVIEVLFSADINDDPVDVTDEALPVGASSSGNAFFFDAGAERWMFNLSTENYSASGTYNIAMKTGDVGEYALAPTCTGLFVID